MENNISDKNNKNRMQEVYRNFRLLLRKSEWLKIGMTLFILAALPTFVFVLQKTLSYKSKASSTPLTLYFSPDTTALSSETTVRVMVNTSGNLLTFSALEIRFNSDLIQLSSTITPTSLFNAIGVTSQADANVTGKIDLVFGLAPDKLVNAPTGTFELANFKITPNAAVSNLDTYLSWLDTQIQIVDANGNAVAATAQPLKLTINPIAQSVTNAARSPSTVPSLTPLDGSITTSTPIPRGKGSSNKKPR